MLIIVDSDKPVKNEYRIYEIQHSLRDILLILLEKDIPITSSIMHTPITATRNIPPSTEAIEYKNLLIINETIIDIHKPKDNVPNTLVMYSEKVILDVKLKFFVKSII